MSNLVASVTDTVTYTADTPQLLLEHHLKQLRLPTILREYDKVARQCAAEDDVMGAVVEPAEVSMQDNAFRAGSVDGKCRYQWVSETRQVGAAPGRGLRFRCAVRCQRRADPG